MALPKAVEEQRKKAEALRQQMYGEQDTEASEEATSEEEATEAEPAEAAESAEAEQQQAPEQSETSDEYRHRYEKLLNQHQSLMGKYNAEVPRLHEQLREAERRIRDLEAQAQQPAEPERQETPQELEWLAEDFGEESAAKLARLIEQKAEQRAREITKSEIEPRLQQVQEREQQSALERFESSLSEAVPKWREINTDPAFHQWLAEYEPAAGKSRQDALNEAGQQLDAQRAAWFFQAFLDEQQPKQPTRSPERHVAPGKARASTPKQKPTYTADDWARLHREKTQGKWRGREQEWDQKRREIHAAIFGQPA